MRKYQGFYNIVKNNSEKEATIYIYGVIGGFDWETYEYINTDSKFVKEFKDLEQDFSVINIRINSPGGDIHQGTPIVNAIRSSKSHVNIYVDGIAYSMAAEIAISGNTLYMYDNSRLMFHNASTGAWGNAQELRTQADVLDSYDKSLAPLLANKLNISEEDAIAKYLNFKDNYFTAKEAKQEGFADVVLSDNTDKLPENIDAMKPEALMKHYAKMNFSKQNPPKQNNMKKHNYPAMQAVLNMDTAFESDETGIYLNEGQPALIEAALSTRDQQIVNLQQQLKESNIVDLQAKLDAADSEKTIREQAEADRKVLDQTLIDSVNNLLELTGENKVTTVEDALKAQAAKIEKLNKAPGAHHSGEPPLDGEDKPDHGIVDFTSSIYDPLRK